MGAVVDLCNVALSRLGDRANVHSIDPPDDSVQAGHCARFYPIALSTILAAHAWGFATKRVAPAKLDEEGDGHQRFLLPADCLRVIKLVDSCGMALRFTVEGRTVRTEGPIGARVSRPRLPPRPAPPAELVYLFMPEPAAFPPVFEDALTWLLASYLAGPVVKGTEGIKVGQACYQQYQRATIEASRLDANERHVTVDFVPSAILARF